MISSIIFDSVPLRGHSEDVEVRINVQYFQICSFCCCFFCKAGWTKPNSENLDIFLKN